MDMVICLRGNEAGSLPLSLVHGRICVVRYTFQCIGPILMVALK